MPRKRKADVAKPKYLIRAKLQKREPKRRMRPTLAVPATALARTDPQTFRTVHSAAQTAHMR